MDSYVLEKQAATASDFDWIVTALKGLASAYANKSLQQTLEKINSLQLKENNTVSLDLGAANEDGKINEQLKLLEGAIEKKCIVQFSYTNSHGEGKEIQAEPVCLQYKMVILNFVFPYRSRRPSGMASFFRSGIRQRSSNHRK